MKSLALRRAAMIRVFSTTDIDAHISHLNPSETEVALTKLAKIRKEQGLTQKALGEKVGVSRQCINALENGGLPSLPLAMRLSRSFAISIADLFPEANKDH